MTGRFKATNYQPHQLRKLCWLCFCMGDCGIIQETQTAFPRPPPSLVSPHPRHTHTHAPARSKRCCCPATACSTSAWNLATSQGGHCSMGGKPGGAGVGAPWPLAAGLADPAHRQGNQKLIQNPLKKGSGHAFAPFTSLTKLCTKSKKVVWTMYLEMLKMLGDICASCCTTA